ncbi:MAG: DUF2029 domain-containing protein [Anaerolineae bacterium]|nr:DUF2029 domain-containing protein [Anaerolineae bacterium]
MKPSYYLWRIVAVFSVSLLVYLGFAYWVLAPMGYYGTREEPRFSDPWIKRGEIILSGGSLYEDGKTRTPPLTNYLLVPPVAFSKLFGHQNPWATLSFMLYFSLFNLLTAFVLFFTPEKAEEGYRYALYFLLNPLTFGNSVWRRQDESILVFAFALALLFAVRQKHKLSSMVVGISLLIKLSGGMIIPVTFFNTRNWQYLVIPFVVFGLVFAPFFLNVGEAAVFWDVREKHNEHPFQYGGISLGRLWQRMVDNDLITLLWIYSISFILGVGAVLGLIFWKPKGLYEDFALLVSVVLLLSPKSHCGYFLILIMALVPILQRYRLQILYFVLPSTALLADMFNFPIRNYPVAFALMIVVLAMLVLLIRQMHSLQRNGAETTVIGT